MVKDWVKVVLWLILASVTAVGIELGSFVALASVGALVSPSVAASVAVLVGILVMVAPSETFVGLGRGMVGVVGEMWTSD